MINAQETIHSNILKVLDLDIEGNVNYKDLASEFGGCFLYIKNPYDITGLESQFEEILEEGENENSIPRKILRKIDPGTQSEFRMNSDKNKATLKSKHLTKESYTPLRSALSHIESAKTKYQSAAERVSKQGSSGNDIKEVSKLNKKKVVRAPESQNDRFITPRRNEKNDKLS